MMEHWSALTTDPNGREIVRRRRDRLAAIHRPPVDDRVGWIASYCTNKIVLNLGCVDQVPEGVEAAPLHRAILKTATRCLGVDLNASGVKSLQAEGIECVCADATSPNLLTAVDGPFDVVVAGELIEHVLNVGGLLANAWSLLEPRGALIITTPNPHAIYWAPKIMFGIHRANVDHVAMFNPYMMAEIADRTGFEFTSWLGAEIRFSRGRRAALAAVGRAMRMVRPVSLADAATVIYVLTRP